MTSAENVLRQRHLKLEGEGGVGRGEGGGEGEEESEREKGEMRGQKCILFCFFPDNDLVVGQTFSFDFSLTIQGWEMLLSLLSLFLSLSLSLLAHLTPQRPFIRSPWYSPADVKGI